jgi:hypothetical protein
MQPLNLLHHRRAKNVVKCLFIGFLEKVHRAADYLKMIRFQMGAKIFLRIPFFKENESILFLDTLAKVATLASLLHSGGNGQRGNRLRQLYTFLRKDIHAYD